jgi:tetratricopeptide (TPR) repeat protein
MELGDFLLAKGTVDKAETFYRALKDNFPKAMNVDAAYVGLGEVALARKDLKKAMELYTYAIDRLGAPYKLKEALLGQAKYYMAEGAASYSADFKETAAATFEKARKLFEEVASVREWRGETTAFALFQIAEIQFRQNKWPEATAMFERVAVTQQKYPSWAARAYNKAADGYRKMGKDGVAKERLKEMLGKEKFQALPEAEEAKKKLAELGGTA